MNAKLHRKIGLRDSWMAIPPIGIVAQPLHSGGPMTIKNSFSAFSSSLMTKTEIAHARSAPRHHSRVTVLDSDLYASLQNMVSSRSLRSYSSKNKPSKSILAWLIILKILQGVTYLNQTSHSRRRPAGASNRNRLQIVAQIGQQENGETTK